MHVQAVGNQGWCFLCCLCMGQVTPGMHHVTAVRATKVLHSCICHRQLPAQQAAAGGSSTCPVRYMGWDPLTSSVVHMYRRRGGRLARPFVLGTRFPASCMPLECRMQGGLTCRYICMQNEHLRGLGWPGHTCAAGLSYHIRACTKLVQLGSTILLSV